MHRYLPDIVNTRGEDSTRAGITCRMHDNPCISKNHAARPVRPAALDKAIVRDVISSLNIVCLNRVLYLMYTNTNHGCGF